MYKLEELNVMIPENGALKLKNLGNLGRYFFY